MIACNTPALRNRGKRKGTTRDAALNRQVDKGMTPRGTPGCEIVALRHWKGFLALPVVMATAISSVGISDAAIIS
jgi:hypothetical protein